MNWVICMFKRQVLGISPWRTQQSPMGRSRSVKVLMTEVAGPLILKEFLIHFSIPNLDGNWVMPVRKQYTCDLFLPFSPFKTWTFLKNVFSSENVAKQKWVVKIHFEFWLNSVHLLLVTTTAFPTCGQGNGISQGAITWLGKAIPEVWIRKSGLPVRALRSQCFILQCR